MCKSNFSFMIVLTFLSTFVAVSKAQYCGGSGTQEDPYQICMVSNWLTLMNSPGDWNKHFIQVADLDLKDAALSPIGNNSIHFTGVFNGNGHVINNAVIEEPGKDYVGLFGCLGQNGEISNIHIDAKITGHSYVGGLVGYNSNGNLLACSATGLVEGTGWYPSYVGGLVGHNDQGILNTCSASSSVNGSNYIGGLVGNNSGGSLTACSASGLISGFDYVGGLMGSNSQADINNCNAVGGVNGHSYLGGLVGGNSNGRLLACSATGPVEGSGWYPSYVGGLVGHNDQGALTTCTASSSVNGGYYHVGGLVGLNSGASLIACSAAGSVNGGDYVGGLVGSNSQASINDCNAVGEVNGHSYLGGLVGDNSNGRLLACSATGPVEGSGWYPSYVGGLVGRNDQGDLTACSASGSVNGGYYHVGGLVGLNSGASLIACSAAGPVNGGDYVGGLVGSNSQASINDCNAVGEINGHSYLGGLVGDNTNSSLSACYSVGHVRGTGWYPSYIGGLVGRDSQGEILSLCFWDIETSGQTTSALGTGKTTEQMKRRSTFTNAGWDFLDEAENGIEETWTFSEAEGEDYPRLCWQVYYRIAYAPDPPDGADYVDPNVTLSWIPSVTAGGHDVYFGDNLDNVNDGVGGTFLDSCTEPNFTVGLPGCPYPDGLVPWTTYYWRIDEVNDADTNSPWQGQVWSFTVPQKKAYNPIPADGVEKVDPNVILSWTAGFGARSHKVYFGEDLNIVNNAVGGISQEGTTYDPSDDPLKALKTYYWRVDEVDEFDGSTTRKGDVWSFTVREWTKTFEYQVTSSEDDGYAYNETSQNLTLDYLRVGASDFTQPPYYISGMVFRNVNIPPGAKIKRAHLKIRSYNSHLTDIVYGKIKAEAANDPAAFSSSRHIASLPTTDASVIWDLNEPWLEDTWYDSPDIAVVIQEVINREGWSAANSLAIFYSTREHENEVGNRYISSYDRGISYAPKLEITYMTP